MAKVRIPLSKHDGLGRKCRECGKPPEFWAVWGDDKHRDTADLCREHFFELVARPRWPHAVHRVYRDVLSTNNTARRQREYPCHDQTLEQFRAWYDEAQPQPGDLIAIRGEQWHTLKYFVTTIAAIDHGHQRKIITTSVPEGGWCGKSWYRSGKNWRHPQSQHQLVTPTQAVLDYKDTVWDESLSAVHC